nr:uncharacterized protein LOC109177253 [Ipomoea batatas]
MNQRWIAPESTAERKLWPGPDLVDNVVKSDGETVGEEVRNAETGNVGRQQPDSSSPAPTNVAASTDPSSSGHAHMQKSAPNATSSAVNMTAGVHFNSDMPATSRKADLAIPNGVGVSFPMWFQQVLTSMDEDAIARCTAILYAIWTARNSAVWEAKVPIPTTMVALADKSLQHWRLSQSTSSFHSPTYAPDTSNDVAEASDLKANLSTGKGL